MIKKDSTTSIRKHANELRVHEKIVKPAIKYDLIPDIKPLDYTIWGVLKNKKMQLPDPNIGSLRHATEGKCKKHLFWRHANPFKGVLIQ